MDLVVLQNKTRQHMTISLDHELYCRFANACGCSRTRVVTKIRPSDGSPAGSKTHRKRHPCVLTLMPGEKSAPLHPVAVKLPQVVTGMHRGMVGVERVAAAPAPEVPPAPARRRAHHATPEPTPGE